LIFGGLIYTNGKIFFLSSEASDNPRKDNFKNG